MTTDRLTRCRHCGGSGTVHYWPQDDSTRPEVETCPTCKGTGQLTPAARAAYDRGRKGERDR